MSSEALSGEQLKEHAIKQALAGDNAGARQTASQIGDRENVRQVWQNILFVAAECRDVHAVKETIASCPDPSLLAGHFYRDLPIDFVRGGDTSGGIEIAKSMGDSGVLPLILIATLLSQKGDRAGMREALSQIEDEGNRACIMSLLDDLRQKKSGTPESRSK